MPNPAKVNGMATVGLHCEPIDTEAHVTGGQSRFTVVGLPDAAVQEARERVRSAIKSSGYRFPGTRIAVNLAPADIKKSGPSYDLPMALGILSAAEHRVDTDEIRESVFMGELALNGDLRHIAGALPIALAAKKYGFKKLFLPTADAKEAALIEGIEVYPVSNFIQMVNHLWHGQKITPVPKTEISAFLDPIGSEEIDMAHVRGQEQAKRALEIAAAGSHNLLMNGAPGAGKTLMARAFRTILPDMTFEEMLEVTQIYSVSNMLPAGKPIITTRPFRPVHHTASDVAVVGGGRNPSPGEVSLAHKGVLFLDEMAEFPSQVLEVLRQPIEDRMVTISRASGTLSFPAHFSLIAAMNPCPCGYHNVPNTTKECTCSPMMISKYLKKISGPLLDRIDLYIDISPVKFEKLTGEAEAAESSAEIRKRVQMARDRQLQRFSGLSIQSNSEMSGQQVKKFCPVTPDAENLLKMAMTQLHLSARGYHRTLKLARTIADLEGKEAIETQHIAEAIQYRPKIEA